jgi:hypothetical protein
MRFVYILLIAAIGPCCAKGQVSCLESYPISFPMGGLHSYIGNVSFRGFDFEVDKKSGPLSAATLEAGWNVFYQHEVQKTYTDGTVSITGVQYRYVNAVPIIAGGKMYFPTGSKAVRPYAGLGLGTLYANRRTDFGLYRIVSEAWQFCIRPELGLQFNMGGGQALIIGAKYYWAFDAGELDAQPYLSVNIGLKISMD